jgi:putative acetyltransferase
VRTRLAEHRDREHLLGLWERSVRATHTFLIESDIDGLRPAVREELARQDLTWWLAVSDADEPIAFMGFKADCVEALFVEPAYRGRGAGRLLVSIAQQLAAGDLFVEVNEQNAAAVGFYEAHGFVTISRSPVDDAGRPFPVLRMRRAHPRELSRNVPAT